MNAVRRAAPKPGSLWAGLVGTLLLHAMLLGSVLHGLRGPTATVSPFDTQNVDYGPLVLIQPMPWMAAGNKRIPTTPARASVLQNVAVVLQLGPLPELPLESSTTSATRASGNIVDAVTFVKKCHESYPDAAHLDHDLAAVSLRGLMASDGRSWQGTIDISAGDRERALMALQCLQAFGTLAATAQVPAGQSSQ
jgi:hypothetical protein